jgi:hypothetical protein
MDSSSNPRSSTEGRGGGRGGSGRQGRGYYGESKTENSGTKRNDHSVVDPMSPNSPSIFSDANGTSAVPSVITQTAAQLPSKKSAPVIVKKGGSNVSSANPSFSSSLSSTAAPSSQITINKKSRKLIVRKLPSTKSYSLPEFETHLKQVLEKLFLISSFENGTIRIDHFIEGKVR